MNAMVTAELLAPQSEGDMSTGRRGWKRVGFGAVLLVVLGGAFFAGRMSLGDVASETSQADNTVDVSSHRLVTWRDRTNQRYKCAAGFSKQTGRAYKNSIDGWFSLVEAQRRCLLDDRCVAVTCNDDSRLKDCQKRGAYLYDQTYSISCVRDLDFSCGPGFSLYRGTVPGAILTLAGPDGWHTLADALASCGTGCTGVTCNADSGYKHCQRRTGKKKTGGPRSQVLRSCLPLWMHNEHGR